MAKRMSWIASTRWHPEARMKTDSPIILALDTTSEFGSVAVRRSRQTVAEIELHSPEGFGQIIFQAIEELLAAASVRLEEIDCFAAASGPGSFTGVRVGLAAVKGMAEALGKPTAGISNLRALSTFGAAALRAVALDARRGAVYGAVYDAAAQLVVPETVSPWASWLRTVPTEAELIGYIEGPCQTAGIAFTVAPRRLAAGVARCAESDGSAGWHDAVALDANYVRHADAELSWKEA
jgi:tRNA threonylcarbamoyladenosine biosynthesis protein TsaB